MGASEDDGVMECDDKEPVKKVAGRKRAERINESILTRTRMLLINVAELFCWTKSGLAIGWHKGTSWAARSVVTSWRVLPVGR